MSRSRIFEQFPKIRSELPRPYKDLHQEVMILNRRAATTATSLSKLMESWMHRQVACDLEHLDASKLKTLEVGAGTLNHLFYETPSAIYDVIEPSDSFFALAPESLNKRIGSRFKSIEDLDGSNSYDRIISVAVLEHVVDLPKLVALAAKLLKPGGAFRAAIPSEGTIMWELGTRLVTGLEFRIKYGLDYQVIMKHEHVNTSAEIDQVLRYFFSSVKVSCFGLSQAVSFYQMFDCREPEVREIEEFLS